MTTVGKSYHKAYIDGLCYIEDLRTGRMFMGCTFQANPSVEMCGRPVRFPKEDKLGQVYYRCYKHPPRQKRRICGHNGCSHYPHHNAPFCKFHDPVKIEKRRQQQHERDLPHFLKGLPASPQPCL